MTKQPYKGTFIMGLPGIGDALAQIPITAECCVPEISLASNWVTFGTCFLRYGYTMPLELVNESSLPAKYRVQPQPEPSQTLAVYIPDPLSGIVEPKSHFTVSLTLSTERLGVLHIPLYVRITGSEGDPLEVILEVVSIGPIIRIERPPQLTAVDARTGAALSPGRPQSDAPPPAPRERPMAKAKLTSSPSEPTTGGSPRNQQLSPPSDESVPPMAAGVATAGGGGSLGSSGASPGKPRASRMVSALSKAAPLEWKPQVDFGKITVLVLHRRSLVLRNMACIPAEFRLFLSSKQSVYEVLPRQGVIEPFQTMELQISVFLDELFTFKDSLNIIITEGAEHVVPLIARGVGTTIVCDEFETGGVHFGNQFTSFPFHREILVWNLGSRPQTLQWTAINPRGTISGAVGPLAAGTHSRPASVHTARAAGENALNVPGPQAGQGASSLPASVDQPGARDLPLTACSKEGAAAVGTGINVRTSTKVAPKVGNKVPKLKAGSGTHTAPGTKLPQGPKSLSLGDKREQKYGKGSTDDNAEKRAAVTTSNGEVITTFNISPTKALINPRSSHVFTITGFSEIPGLHFEKFSCRATLANTTYLLYNVVVDADMAIPMLKLSSSTLSYLYFYHRETAPQPLPMSQNLEVQNISALPLTLHMQTKPPFSVTDPSWSLQPGEGCVSKVDFDPGPQKERVTSTIQGQVVITLSNNPHRYNADLVAEINFPNLKLEPPAVIFGPVLEHSSKRIYVRATNTSKLDVHYSWLFVENSDDPTCSVTVTSPIDRSLIPTTTAAIVNSPTVSSSSAAAAAIGGGGGGGGGVEVGRSEGTLTVPGFPGDGKSEDDRSLVTANARNTVHNVQSIEEEIPVNHVFDLIPIRGCLKPGESEVMEFTYHALEGCRARTLAVCEVEGGPAYEIPVQAESGAIEYTWDKHLLDFGHVLFNKPIDTDLYLANTGKVIGSASDWMQSFLERFIYCKISWTGKGNG
ncbi:hypothetical protein CBR_g26251 [Chara braunii]|uniref:HYDIN/VesB/CFA65-like Ig-like domain-containing protein n=1 Tax=Chara braunii TaxID=69332 RepID=A0A388L7G3_CHABU|nr:hypothetical protein CBR_g26251 [Chara braunii]|eukprot:GBG78218.1 hypothetical protein CBR_g26251 [Chara braunii]